MSPLIPGTHTLISSDTLGLMAWTIVVGVPYIALIARWIEWLDQREARRIERRRRMRRETP